MHKTNHTGVKVQIKSPDFTSDPDAALAAGVYCTDHLCDWSTVQSFFPSVSVSGLSLSLTCSLHCPAGMCWDQHYYVRKQHLAEMGLRCGTRGHTQRTHTYIHTHICNPPFIPQSVAAVNLHEWNKKLIVTLNWINNLNVHLLVFYCEIYFKKGGVFSLKRLKNLQFNL